MERKWWKECFVYQIYPRSFCDSDNDGIGDLRGIISRLDYLKDLGIGAVWLCPVYDSPNDDNGYDIRDYDQIMKEFGTMEDMKTLISEMHFRGIRLIMDLVVNHTSDEHKWFIESRSSKDSPYRDYYIWRDGSDSGEPNNWASYFTPSAWKYDPWTNQYYLHLFSEKQPDLNWKNPELRNEIYAMINRWFDLGVDGFRMDVINLIAKHDDLPDGTGVPNSEGKVMASEFFATQLKLYDYIREMNLRCCSGRDCVRIAETPFVTENQISKLVNENSGIFDMLFSFDLMEMDNGPMGKYDPVEWTWKQAKKIINSLQNATKDGWSSLFWTNHDQPRTVSHFGNDSCREYWLRSSKMLATLMFLLRGTPFIYQGEELGMTNVPFRSEDDLRDIEAVFNLREGERFGVREKTWKAILAKCRDNARSPMQWNSGINAGFSSGTPWIMVNPNYTEINAEDQERDENSILNYFKKLIRLRNSSDTLKYGTYSYMETPSEDLFCYRRKLGEETYTVICNTSCADEITMPFSVQNFGEPVLSNIEGQHESFLSPYECRVYNRKA